MSPPSAIASLERQSGVEDTASEQRVVALAAARLAQEASAVLHSHARLIDQVQRATSAALKRISDGAGAPADVLADVTREIVFLHDLISAMDRADVQDKFFQPDSILDHVVAGASLRAEKYGVTIDYVRSFSNFAMFGAPAALTALMSRCIDAAAQRCGGETLYLRANFYDAHDGRRMLRMVIGAGVRGIDLSAAETKALAGGSSASSVVIKDGSMIVMMRAPLAAPARLFFAQPDVEFHGV